MSNEARMYSMFPDHLFQDWAGYVIIPPMMQPHALQPVVPNFYGHYFPEDIPDEAQDSLTSSARERARDHVLGQIMLLEDCGRNVQPAELSRRQKEECWSLLCRLHYAGFTQGSMYQRNVMIQPGPLSIPPERRSMATPSYRIIDFGRARAAADCSESDLQERKKQDQDGAGELLDIHCAFVSSSRIPNPGDYVPKPPPVIPLQPAPLD
ncbi:hypothetical protein BOTBODRAFT_116057 [Botryobasidium botryosum FD-172 SS1]|uniref:Protein kinase domain-containing protein n=1 Tax=Botryobasidium botryosum (strain FD-172 SS1) TaxID=930990 RepID=A0A067MEK8_BOTB1|nr:hypothetical protein BOTBODRAFT_116057 [Botryobasidium botryosum FD-172 SS1]